MLTEPIDVYSEWIDSLRRAGENPELDDGIYSDDD